MGVSGVDPACGRAGEFVALGEGAFALGEWREEEEDVAIGDGQVEDDVALGVLVAACDVAVEACKGQSVS